MRKKTISMFLAAAMTVSLVCGMSFNGTNAVPEISQTKVRTVKDLSPESISVKGITALKTPVHKIVALVVEYPENVAAPDASAYTITDTEARYFTKANEKADSATAKITAVYTNSKPEMRADQKSVAGPYVIIELEDSTDVAFNEADGLWHTNYAGVATCRYDKNYTGFPDNSIIRTNWSNFVVQQNVNIVNQAGNIVSTPGTLPSLKYEELTNLVIDDFTDLNMVNSKGHPIYGKLYVPKDYDAGRSYPLVVDASGGSQRLIFNESGTPINYGANLTRDTGAVGWLSVTDDVIIVTPQLQNKPPYEYDEYQDTYEMIQKLMQTYNIDTDRIYGIGSSYGTLHLSTVISQHPDLFTAYVQCNGNFVNATNMYVDEADVPGADYTNESLIKPDSEYYADFKAALQGVVDNEVKMVICHGKNDPTAPITRGVTTYRMLVRMYQEMGKSQEEIDRLVKINIYEDEDFLKKGIWMYHEANKMASLDIDLMTWVLEQSKSGKEVVLTKNLPLAENMEINLDDYYGQVIEGYYNFDCVVSPEVTRTAKFYIPKHTVYNQPTVFVGVPNGVNTWDFLVQSGWKALADEKLLHIVMMEPENGTWGSPEAEIAYINALNQDVSYRPFFCAFSSNFYAAAYGESADILLAQSQESPKSWGGIAVLGTAGITQEQLNKLNTTDSKVAGVTLAQVQTPVWIVSSANDENVRREIDFYRTANHSQPEKANAGYAAEVYLPQTGGTVDDEWCSKVVFDQADWKNCVNTAYSRNIYTELFEGVYRYPGDANGALRRPGEIFSRGFKKFEAQVAGGFAADGSDVYNREWYVYAPASVDLSKPAPVVFVFHGAGGSGNEIADRSGWAKVAEDKGIILVCPTGSHQLSVRRVSDIVTNELFRAMWNTGDATAERPSDLKFVEFLYGWIASAYNVDLSRVYASGQSSGGMMSWACAAKLPHIFAAAAPVSATRAVEPDNGPLIPIMAFIGEKDSTFPGGFGSDDGKEAIDFWTKRSNTTQTWGTYTYMDGGKNCSGQNGLFTNYLFTNKDGVPMLRCLEVATKTHAIWPSECYMAWEEWFTHFTKEVKTGTLYYDGTAVR